MKNFIEATIVGASEGMDLSLLNPESDIYALNSAYFHLVANKFHPAALITGDKRFIFRAGGQRISSVNRLITFFDKDLNTNKDLEALHPAIEFFPCLGRDGFSSNRNEGFYHGCSSFFFAVQYLVSVGYKKINTLGVNFPPPETYTRLNGVSGHPEFVYDIQLKNLFALKNFLASTNTEINCHDNNSNLNIFL